MNLILLYSKTAFNKIEELWQNQTVLVYLLAAMLMTLPLKHNIGSMTCIIFLLVCFSKAKKANFSISKVEILPIILYVLMMLSLLWTIDMRTTTAGLQKEILVLLMPIAFCFLPNLNPDLKNRVFKIFSYSMVFFALFCLAKAVFKFINSGDASVFFYHELVTASLNAIYVSGFASFGMFYFLVQKNKTISDQLALLTLVVFVFLSFYHLVFVLTNILLFRCDEIEKEKVTKGRLAVEEAITDAKVRRCPTCKKSFIKDSGCNKITCGCGKIHSKYSHLRHTKSKHHTAYINNLNIIQL